VAPEFQSFKIYCRLPEGPQGDVTQLPAQWREGDHSALDAATRIVYAELRKIADGYLRKERAEHTLQPTALINVPVPARIVVCAHAYEIAEKGLLAADER